MQCGMAAVISSLDRKSVLYSVPTEEKDLNFTYGYNVRSTSLDNLIYFSHSSIIYQYFSMFSFFPPKDPKKPSAHIEAANLRDKTYQANISTSTMSPFITLRHIDTNISKHACKRVLFQAFSFNCRKTRSVGSG